MATIVGTNGPDFFFPGTPNYGTINDDRIFGLAGDDYLFGNSGNDLIDGGDGQDQIFGEAGNDVLNGGTGTDVMQGGTGNDRYIVDDVNDSVVENSGEGTDVIWASVNYILSDNVENLALTGTTAVIGTGNTLDNYLQGNSANNILSGLQGNDNLSGNAGDDTLDGGDGNDYLTGGVGVDVMQGGTGNDLYIVDDVNDSVVENPGEGTDVIWASVNYTLSDNVENLALTGTTAVIGIGNLLGNNLQGNSANNILSGLQGNDNFSGDAGDDTLDGGDGNDVINGGLGNDSLSGGVGADVMQGGAGNDFYVVDALNDSVVENLGEGTDMVWASIDYTLSKNVENLALTGTTAVIGIGNLLGNNLQGNSANNILSGLQGNDNVSGNTGDDTIDGGDGNDNISGDAGDDTLDGGDGNDYLNGGLGNDSLSGGVGADVMQGGIGSDLYIVDDVNDSVVENPGEGTDPVWASVNYTLSDNVENLALTGTAAVIGIGNLLGNYLLGNSANNILSGLQGNDNLSGNAGDDTLDGGDGNDYLTGGVGVDVMQGGTGNDLYIVDDVNDSVVENPGEGTDVIWASVNYTLSDNVENLALTGTTAVIGIGNLLGNNLQGNSANNILSGLQGNDNFSGDAGDDTLDGGDGNDVINGGVGVDVMQGGTGNDRYIVDDVNDSVVENPGEGTDVIWASVNYTLSDNVENLALTGTTAVIGIGNLLGNNLQGNSANNILSGLQGRDNLSGNSGDDKLDGGDGNDVLLGGMGSDSFTFSGTSFSQLGTDIINDFSNIEGDQIQLSQSVFTRLTDISTEFTSVLNDSAAATSKELIVYSQESGNLFYNEDGMIAGFGAGGKFATLTSKPSLTYTDLVIL